MVIDPAGMNAPFSKPRGSIKPIVCLPSSASADVLNTSRMGDSFSRRSTVSFGSAASQPLSFDGLLSITAPLDPLNALQCSDAVAELERQGQLNDANASHHVYTLLAEKCLTADDPGLLARGDEAADRALATMDQATYAPYTNAVMVNRFKIKLLLKQGKSQDALDLVPEAYRSFKHQEGRRSSGEIAWNRFDPDELKNELGQEHVELELLRCRAQYELGRYEDARETLTDLFNGRVMEGWVDTSGDFRSRYPSRMHELLHLRSLISARTGDMGQATTDAREVQRLLTTDFVARNPELARARAAEYKAVTGVDP